MAHIHFAWELGGGLGHAGRLKPLAQEAARRGHRVTLSLRDLTQTQALLSGLGLPLFQAPVWLHKVHGIPMPEVSIAEILQGCGYLNPDTLRGMFQGWGALLEALQPDLLVGDYAPTAMLAARASGLRHCAIGIGFYLPPAGCPLPSLRDWETAQPARLAASEAQLLNAANTVLREASPALAPLSSGAELLNGQHTLMQTWPELDHYQRKAWPAGLRWLGPALSTAGGQPANWPQGDGPRVFAYLKASHTDHAQVLQALVALGCSTVCYMPEVASGMAPPVVHPLLHYATGAVDLDDALGLPFSGASHPGGCRLCICHAGEGVVGHSLLAGVPVFMLPTQVEQFLLARSVEATGAGLNSAARKPPQDYLKALGLMLNRAAGSGRYRDASQALAAKYAGFSPVGQAVEMVDEFERLLALR